MAEKGPGKHTPEQLIRDAKTIDELCDVIIKIGPISKGFLKGKTDPIEAVGHIRGDFYNRFHKDSKGYLYYQEYNDKYGVREKIIELIEAQKKNEDKLKKEAEREVEMVKSMSEDEKTEYINNSNDPEDLYRRIKLIGNFDLKMGIDDSAAQIQEIKKSCYYFLHFFFQNDMMDIYHKKTLDYYLKDVSQKYGLREKVKFFLKKEINNFCLELISFINSPKQEFFYKSIESENSEFDKTKLEYKIDTYGLNNPLYSYFKCEELTEKDKVRYGERKLYLFIIDYKGIKIGTYWEGKVEYFKTAASRMGGAAADLKLREFLYPKEQFEEITRKICYLRLSIATDTLFTAVKSLNKAVLVAPNYRWQLSLEEEKTMPADNVNVETKKKTSAKEKPRNNQEDRNGLDKNQVADRVYNEISKIDNFTSYQDYLNTCLYLIDKYYPKGVVKNNVDIQEIFELVDEKVSKSKGEGKLQNVESEDVKKIVEDVVSKARVRYSYGEYSRKDIKELIADLTRMIVESLKMGNFNYNGKIIMEILLKTLEKWSITPSLIPNNKADVSKEISTLREAIEKVHYSLKENKQAIEKISQNQSSNVSVIKKYVLFENFNLKGGLVNVEVDVKMDINKVVEKMWESLKKFLGL